MSRNNLLVLTIFALIIGPVAAFTSHIFLWTLEFIASSRTEYPHLIWSLPVTGLFMTLAYKKIPPKLNWGVSQMLLELRNPKERSNPFLSLWIFMTSSLAHLGGASVGREGVGLIINGSLIDGINPFKEDSEERSILLQAALSAGFTGMFGTPLAGIFFIFEINEFKKGLSFKRWLMIVLAVASTHLMGKYLGTPHAKYPAFRGASWQGMLLLIIAVPLVTYLFYYTYRYLHRLFKHMGEWHLVFGGWILAIILFFLGTRYSGLGTEIIHEAVTNGVALNYDFILKLLLTALSIAIGFKGGEVTPLFFIGATLGGTLGSFTSDPELSKLGMVVVLGSLTHTPLSAGILGYELFGPWALPWSLLISWWGKWLLRERHLYRFT